MLFMCTWSKWTTHSHFQPIIYRCFVRRTWSFQHTRRHQVFQRVRNSCILPGVHWWKIPQTKWYSSQVEAGDDVGNSLRTPWDSYFSLASSIICSTELGHFCIDQVLKMLNLTEKWCYRRTLCFENWYKGLQFSRVSMIHKHVSAQPCIPAATERPNQEEFCNISWYSSSDWMKGDGNDKDNLYWSYCSLCTGFQENQITIWLFLK